MRRFAARSAIVVVVATTCSGPAFARMKGFSLSEAPSSHEKPKSRAVLASEINRLFDEDQEALASVARARSDPAVEAKYKDYLAQVKAAHPNFYDPFIYALWSREPGAPEAVRSYAAFRTATNRRLQAIVATYGWPRRGRVGDEAAAKFLFIFGHADDANDWRLTQLPVLATILREDHLNPQMYAHIVDRLADVGGRPQVFGSIMGPGDSARSAKLYAPLNGDEAAVDQRRRQIGLPSISAEMEEFRRGADIGPFMTPLLPGQTVDWRNVFVSSENASTGLVWPRLAR